MKNSLQDVKNHLIAAMERLNDDELFTDKESVEKEIQKATALSALAEQIVNVNQVQINEQEANIRTVKLAYDMGYEFKPNGMDLKELPGIGVKQALKKQYL